LAHATHVYVRTVRGSPHVEKFCQNSTTAVWAIAIFYFEKKNKKKTAAFDQTIINAYKTHISKGFVSAARHIVCSKCRCDPQYGNQCHRITRSQGRTLFV